MVKCANCGTGWTSSGLPLCPVCGTKVPTPAAVAKPPQPAAHAPMAAPEAAAACKSASAVLEVPPGIRREEPRIVERAVEPARPPVMKKEEPVEAEPRLQLLDASAVDVPVQKERPAPARPLNGPLILGVLAFVPALVLPLAVAFEATRVLGVLGFCMSGFFAPFAPIAWMVGLAAEKRRRDQDLRPERRVSIGRRMGQAATLLLVAEMTVSLVAIAALRLAGKFPATFWSYF